SLAWIFAAYFALAIGEVLVYGTRLDLSYACAPAHLKGLVTACFLLTNAGGNLINTQFAPLYGTVLTPTAFFIIDSLVVLAAAFGFYFVARRFPGDRGMEAVSTAA